MQIYPIIGNNKKVTMETNDTQLTVIGNDCVIKVRKNTGNIEVIGNGCVIIVKYNTGRIEVIGNDCKVHVVENYGTINVIGANGIVTVAKRFKNDGIQLIGNSCQLLVDAKENSTFEPFSSQLSPYSNSLDDVIESMCTFVMR